MDKDLKYGFLILSVAAVISIIAIAYSIANPSPSRVETFVGRLDSIEYEQGGWMSSVSATILHFQTGETFKQSGYYEYALGYQYKVIYKVTSRLFNATIFYNPALITVLSVERYN
jgi:hypothetical protein